MVDETIEIESKKTTKEPALQCSLYLKIQLTATERNLSGISDYLLK